MVKTQRISVFLDASVKQFISGFKHAQSAVGSFAGKIRSDSQIIINSFKRWGQHIKNFANRFRTSFQRVLSGIRRITGAFRTFGGALISNVITRQIAFIKGQLESLGVQFDLTKGREFYELLRKIKMITGANIVEMAKYRRDIEKAADATMIERNEMAKGFIRYYQAGNKPPDYKQLFNLGFKSMAWMGQPEDVATSLSAMKRAAGTLGYKYDEETLATVFRNAVMGSPLYDPKVFAEQSSMLKKIIPRFNPGSLEELGSIGAFLTFATKGEPNIGEALGQIEWMTRRSEGWDTSKYNYQDVVDLFVKAIIKVQTGKGRILDYKGRDLSTLIAGKQNLMAIQNLSQVAKSMGIKPEHLQQMFKEQGLTAVETMLQNELQSFTDNTASLDAQINLLNNKITELTSKMMPGLIKMLDEINRVFTEARIATISDALVKIARHIPDLATAILKIAERFIPEKTVDTSLTSDLEKTIPEQIAGTMMKIMGGGKWLEENFFQYSSKVPLELIKKYAESMGMPVIPKILDEILSLQGVMTQGLLKSIESLIDFTDVTMLNFRALGEKDPQKLEVIKEILSNNVTKEDIEKFNKNRPEVSFDEIITNSQYLGELMDIYLKRKITDRFKNLNKEERIKTYPIPPDEESTSDKQSKKETSENLKKIGNTMNNLTRQRQSVIFNLNIDPNTGEMTVAQHGNSNVRSTIVRPTRNLMV